MGFVQLWQDLPNVQVQGICSSNFVDVKHFHYFQKFSLFSAPDAVLAMNAL